MTGEWTPEQINTLLSTRYDDLVGRLNERHDAQIKAVDAAFAAGEARNRVALEAAEKAVTKAESASERRFESINEFRGQLNDMINTLMPRAEAQTRDRALIERLDTMRDAQTALSSRLDLMAGQSKGVGTSIGFIVGAVGVITSIIIVVIALVGFVS